MNPCFREYPGARWSSGRVRLPLGGTGHETAWSKTRLDIVVEQDALRRPASSLESAGRRAEPGPSGAPRDRQLPCRRSDSSPTAGLRRRRFVGPPPRVEREAGNPFGNPLQLPIRVG